MPQSSLKGRRVAVIGGGVAGVVAARHLVQRGAHVSLFEKSRGLGGRLATRRLDGGVSADHGAQFVTARGKAFNAFMNICLEQKTFSVWQPCRNGKDRSGAKEAWYVGAPAMNSALKVGNEGIDVSLNAHVTAISVMGNSVSLDLQDAPSQQFDQVIVTAPAPQASSMIRKDQPDLAAQIDKVIIAPSWTLMLVFSQSLGLKFDAWRAEHPVLGWAACNSSKPGRDFAGESWTVQANAHWSKQHLELEKEAAANILLAEFEQLIDMRLNEITEKTAHRWRYAMTLEPLGQPFLKDRSGRLYIAGDWCLGARVECAYDSGTQAAEDIISQLS
jgi:predicted NAD/FAD-dependent oxidoreductase